MPRVALYTLGCKVNQYETEKVAEDFRARGFDLVDFAAEADVYVINSCTVTHTADSKSRRAARAAIRRNPGAKVVFTGCYAETSPDDAAQIDGLALVIGNREKDRLVDRVISILPSDLKPARPAHPDSQPIPGRTRALLKVQDGCDQFCAYCAVPLARSVMWSKPFGDVVSEATELAKRGYKEVVLTGIRLGRYERDGRNLTHLMEALAEISGIERIRLSSIEICDIPDGLLGLMAGNGKVCRHLHLPLQSGDDGVLARMKRPYTSSEFEEFAAKARAAVPGIGITTDIMVGFPGETEDAFENTVRFAERIRFSRAHVFRYSSRQRTAAARMPDGVPAQEKQRRSEKLIRLASDCAQEFAEQLIGKTVEVLAEGNPVGPGRYSGLTDSYVRVEFEESAHLVGKMVDVRVDCARDGVAHGIVDLPVLMR